MAIESAWAVEQQQQLAGSLLRLARAKAGLTQRELAARAGVHQSTVARIESGASQPTLPTLTRLISAAGLDLTTHLVPYDDHDDVLFAEEQGLTGQERAARDAKQRRLAENAVRR